MSVKRHERTHARRGALLVLYQAEVLDTSIATIIEDDEYIEEIGILSSYALNLLAGIDENRTQIDGYLTDTSENWALSRMPIVDRSILRLAVFEMLYVNDVPFSVTINEAVELAKDFGGEDDSPRFVNGILGRIAKSLEEDCNAG